jgi:SAM-dependent methyltransferase
VSERKSVLTGSAQAQFDQRLKIHTSWQHPGLIFRPMHLTAFRDIVALDPMYLVDTHQDYLTAVTKDFTERYQSRVRNYIIQNQHKTGRLLDRLPNYQFGLVAAQDFFNYKPIEFVNKLLDEVFCLLKPGGAFVFTYNNCDYAGAVKLAESDFACYTPGRSIKEHAIKLGYEINYDFSEINGTGILELGKPGKKISLRGGQTLAVVKETVRAAAVSTESENKKIRQPKVIDNSVTKHYTEDEKRHLQMSAVVMEIDTEDNIVANYSAEKLDELVTNRLNTRDFNHEKFQKRLDKFIQKRKHT